MIRPQINSETLKATSNVNNWMKMSFLLWLCSLLFFHSANAQKKKEISDVKYRRSSLHTVLIPSTDYHMSDIVERTYYKAPFPDKYNNHDVNLHVLDRSAYPMSDEEMTDRGEKRTWGKAFGAEMLGDLTNGTTDPTAKEVPFQIEKFIDSTKIANKLVAKWFDRNEDGTFGMELIQERGMYDASVIDKSLAEGSARGTALLADAGEELLGKTFVVCNKMRLVENEKIAAAVRDAALSLTSEMKDGMAKDIAEAPAKIAYAATKEGYTIFTNSYLHKLVWNDSVAAVFYNDYWIGRGTKDEAKKRAIDESDLFKLEYIGSTRGSSVVMPFGKSKDPDSSLVKLVTIRNVAKVYAKLQKEFDVFKPMTPILSEGPITAHIGMKEGLEGGEKFEVLEQMYDEKKQRTYYIRKGLITVDKKLVWDNRVQKLADVGIVEVQPIEVEDGKKKKKPSKKELSVQEAVALGATSFKGKGSFYAGMLLRQVE